MFDGRQKITGRICCDNELHLSQHKYFGGEAIGNSDLLKQTQLQPAAARTALGVTFTVDLPRSTNLVYHQRPILLRFVVLGEPLRWERQSQIQKQAADGIDPF